MRGPKAPGETGTASAAPQVRPELPNKRRETPRSRVTTNRGEVCKHRPPPGNEGDVPFWIRTSLWANHTSGSQTGILK